MGGDKRTLPSRFLVPAITGSADIPKASNHVISAAESLRRIICLPRDLGSLDKCYKAAVDHFPDWARGFGADQTYAAQHRSPGGQWDLRRRLLSS